MQEILIFLYFGGLSVLTLSRRVVGVNYPAELQENEGAGQSLIEVTWTCVIDLEGTKKYAES